MMSIEKVAKSTGAVIVILGFFWGIFEYLQTQQIQAARPYLEKKLEWCEDAVTTASKLATTNPPKSEDIAKFAQLYWGTMGMIENEQVKLAMIEFAAKFDFEHGSEIVPEREAKGNFIKNDDLVIDPFTLGRVQELSLNLAHACRDELAREWSPSWGRSGG